MTMSLYQPVLFVGLGGSGCDIGAVVERRLRREICGPDGTDFIARNRATAALLPYQLPRCLQFVYADMNAAELERMPRRAVQSRQHVPAAQQNARYSSDLVPIVSTYPQLAANLRLAAQAETEQWLPPEPGEPRVVPLTKGAAQLPTIGRAALFGAFLEGHPGTAFRDLRTAVAKLSSSGGDLALLGGHSLRAVDVFVAFSVAGGTGAGIFYDYLHLIDQAFDEAHMRARLYPLVLMPSAFGEGHGGGRYAQLNAARALVDLFQLVDMQNAGLAWHEQAVRYPVAGKMKLRPGTVQTAFLFSRPVGATRTDLLESIGSLVLSLIGTESGAEQEHRSGAARSSFSDWFVNAGNNRQVPAVDGLGNRNVSSALVASLTVPTDDLAGIVSGRLLREAIRQLSAPSSTAESNREHIARFLDAAGVHAVLTREAVAHPEPGAARGARGVAVALNSRAEAMTQGITVLRKKLRDEVPRYVSGLEPQRAIRELLAELDPFRVRRVAFGHPDLPDEVGRAGAAGLLRSRAVPPPAPADAGIEPPTASELRSGLSLRQPRWEDRESPAVRQIRRMQDDWYQWRTNVVWAEEWHAHAAQWQRALADTDVGLSNLTRELLEFADANESRYWRQVDELYRLRAGIAYLLPRYDTGTNAMEQFYLQVRRRLIDDLAAERQLPPEATEADLVQALLLRSGGWGQAYVTSLDGDPAQAVTDLRDLLRGHVLTCLSDTTAGRTPLLPKLDDLVASATREGKSAMAGYVEELSYKLAGLIAAGFTPPGSGPMRVLISYPSDTPSPAVERYLTDRLNLPDGPGVRYEMENNEADSITVTLLRTEMGMTEVDEVRDVLRTWAYAHRAPEPADMLRWRQRTGYHFGYLATTAEQRIEILHRLLCALWNGQVTAIGDPASPDRIEVSMGRETTISLRLAPMQGASSWASLLSAYELQALDDDARMFSAKLMREIPAGLNGDYQDPDPLYMTVVGLADEQTALLTEMVSRLQPAGQARAELILDFWTQMLPSALEREFTDFDAPARPNLRSLQLAVAHRRQE